MKDFVLHRLLSLVVATVLLAAMVLGATSCGNADPNAETTTSADTTTAALGDLAENVVGEGQTSFTFEVTFIDGMTKAYTVKTDAETVGEALQSAGLIAGEEGPYGLYVKTVDGVTLDWDKDGKYWAFYINGEMAMTGVDGTSVTAGATYAFRAE